MRLRNYVATACYTATENDSYGFIARPTRIQLHGYIAIDADIVARCEHP